MKRHFTTFCNSIYQNLKHSCEVNVQLYQISKKDTVGNPPAHEISNILLGK